MTWTVVANSWQYTSIYGADGKRLFLMDLEDWGVTEENQEELEKQQADIARLASAAPELLNAVTKLANEAGALSAFELEIREVIGNTNWTVLQLRISEAKAALAKAVRS